MSVGGSRLVRFVFKASIENLEQAVAANDGSCMPSLRSQGTADPFFGVHEVAIVGRRVPSMHAFGDSKLVFEFVEDGLEHGSTMGDVWYFGPDSVLTMQPELESSHEGAGHGAPGYTLAFAHGGQRGGGRLQRSTLKWLAHHVVASPI